MKKLPTVLFVLFLLCFAVGTTFYITANQLPKSALRGSTKIEQKTGEIMEYLDRYFVDEYDEDKMAQEAARAMVSAGTDPWSFYLPADETDAYEQTMSNSYVGIGVTIENDTEIDGLLVCTVSKGGPAEKAGVRIGDVIVSVDGKSAGELGVDGVRNLIVGEQGQNVMLAVMRNGETLKMNVTRDVIKTEVATLEMLNPRIAYISIMNFDDRAAEETLDCIDRAKSNGAEGIIFDVRFNGGGYMDNLVKILDELLPEGDIITAVDYSGHTEKFTSDARYNTTPAVVLVNEYSYSAAEFFAAALQEYGRAEIIGTATTGKGNFQNSFTLSDGSILNLSVGKYYTPNGKSLTDTGITPDVPVDLSDEQLMLLYAGNLEKNQDPQLQKAFEILWNEIT